MPIEGDRWSKKHPNLVNIVCERLLMEKLLDLAHENLVNILGGHGIEINIDKCQPNPRNGHLCTKQLKTKASFR